ncbi:hypothetical protein QJ857_gp0704 [Tupanvirus soda lake]|uniref:Ankyrin repeat protein n=2 Tax=Tupanvirus TaxID=2094720 RepID=A0A6N1NVI6_9VIRU|nr:hypothetical protein QJ857_gp0704 [Tupanvirus soda lake]QKU35343.1 hypothetical protein [Tupanvirus soda lake]
MTLIEKILAIDNEHRVVGVDGDLYTIDKLVSDLTLDYDTPTLCGNNYDKPNIFPINSKAAFKNKFNKNYPFLKNINMKNLLIAGGFVSNIIRGVKNYDSDIDFFVYGLTPEQATSRIKEWLLDIIKPKNPKENINNDEDENEDENDEDDDDNYNNDLKRTNKNNNTSNKNEEDIHKIGNYKLIRNKNSITVFLEDKEIKIQLIFRLYKTISEILHGFDLGSSAVGYDGSDVYFTSLGKFCHEYSCNIIDTTRRSTTYEYRLKKYFDRGFNIVLPKLNISELRTAYFKYNKMEICELPYFTFGYTKIIGNKIIVKEFFNQYKNSSDYDLEPMNPINVYYQSLKINIINLINDVDYFYYVSSHIDEENVDILNKPPRLTKGNIITFYDDIREKISKKHIDVSLIKTFITIEKVETIVSTMFDKNIDTKKYFDELIEKQKSWALSKLDKLLARDHNQIDWIVDNPGKQLTSSFNPIIEDESKWYSEKYYRSK